MIHDTLVLVHEQITIPHIVVAIILGSIGRIAWGVMTRIGGRIEDETDRYLKTHVLARHRSAYRHCKECSSTRIGLAEFQEWNLP